MNSVKLRNAEKKDTGLILRFIKAIAEYEHMSGDVMRIAVERGCQRFEWNCLDWNKPSIDFYLSLGAKPLSDWTQYRISGDTLIKLADEV